MPKPSSSTIRSMQIAATAFAAALLAFALVPALVRAQAPGATMYICRTAASGETPNAHMGTSIALECKPVAMRLKSSNGTMHTIGTVSAKSSTGPAISNALTPQQINDAWVNWVNAEFHVNHSP